MKSIDKPAMSLPIGSGIRVIKNEMLAPNEIMLVVGVEAYELIKKSGQLEGESNE